MTPAFPPLAAVEAAFTPAAWSAGEDYALQDRVQGLRRAGQSLAAKVLGVRDDYWVRCALGDSPVSVCTCGRPRCRHAAAIVQAYYSRRVRAVDADAAIDAFLVRPRRTPLVAAVLGEDLLDALRIPADRAEDLASIPDEEAVLAMQEALAASPDRAALLLGLLPRAAAPGPVQDLLRAWLGEAVREPGQWLRFYAAAPDALLPFLDALEPAEWPPSLRPAVMAALWRAAAQEDARLSPLAAVAARRAPHEAYDALRALVPRNPELIGAMIAAGAADGRAGRALAYALRCAAALPSPEQERALREIMQASDGHPGARAEALLRRAALSGDARALLAARRAAVRAGCWPRLRRIAPALLRGREDAIALETRLQLADGDIDGAARTAARARNSSLPERLVANALKDRAPAEARLHALRADAIARRLEEADAGRDGGRRRAPQEDRTRSRKD